MSRQAVKQDPGRDQRDRIQAHCQKWKRPAEHMHRGPANYSHERCSAPRRVQAPQLRHDSYGQRNGNTCSDDWRSDQFGYHHSDERRDEIAPDDWPWLGKGAGWYSENEHRRCANGGDEPERGDVLQQCRTSRSDYCDGRQRTKRRSNPVFGSRSSKKWAEAQNIPKHVAESSKLLSAAHDPTNLHRKETIHFP